jgi:predicted Rossmann-fold nucleotide-binding protein
MLSWHSAGTFEEILEQWTWSQLGIHAKPCGVLNCNEYFAPLRMMVERMVDEGFLHERHKASLIFGGTIEEVLSRLQDFHAPLAKY